MRSSLGQTWKYSDKFAPAAPVLSLALGGMTFECMIDTGFSGGVLIPFSTFESLGFLSGLVPDQYWVVMPDSSRVAVYTTTEEVAVGPAKVETTVHSSQRIEKRLVGRALLAHFVATLDGPDEVSHLEEQGGGARRP